MKLPKLNKISRKDFLFFSLVICLLVSLILIQVNIWAGDYSYSSLKDLKKEIKEKEDLTLELERKNLLLEQEKNRLSSGRDAIEGLARSELGLIKPGETFYKFKPKQIKDKEINPSDIKQGQ